MRRYSAIGGSLVASLLTVALAWPAYAVSWGTLTVNEGGKQQGRANGNYYNHNQTHARNNASFIDAKPGGDGIFVDTRHTFLYADCSSGSCNPTWHETGHDQSPRTTSGAWAYDEAYENLSRRAQTARGVISVCEDHSFGNDPCSAVALPGFNY